MNINERKSNFELLRIISTLMIIMSHVIYHGKLMDYSNGLVETLLMLLKVLTIVHVNSFILVTGFFQVKSNFKFKKLLKLNNMAWFYRIIIVIVALFFLGFETSNSMVIRYLLPIDLGFNWFINSFLILYALSPFLNIIINKMEKPDFEKMLITMFLLFVFLPTATGQQAFNNHYGYYIINFILLYFIGAYIRLYRIPDVLKNIRINFEKLSKKWYFILFLGIGIVNFLLDNVGTIIIDKYPLFAEVGKAIKVGTLSYGSPLVIIGSIFYFMIFYFINFKSKIINKIGSLVFGIYLIHDNPIVRTLLFDYLKLNSAKVVNSSYIFLRIFLITLSIFIVCAVIELLRQIFMNILSRAIVAHIAHKKEKSNLVKFQN